MFQEIKKEKMLLGQRINFRKVQENVLSGNNMTGNIFTKVINQLWANLMIDLETSSIHGLNHMIAFGRHPFEIGFWLVTFCLSVFGALYLYGTIWARYQHSPTVVSMDRDIDVWNTTFPSVTVCLDTKLDMDKVALYVKNSLEPNKKLLEQFIVALANARYGSLNNILNYEGIAPKMYMDLIVNLTSLFQPTVTVGVSGIMLAFIPTITEMGLCYSVNSNVAMYNSPVYRAANRWDVIKTNTKTLSVHRLDGEILAQILNISTGYKVYIHGPEEFPDIATKFQHSAAEYYLKIYVTAFTSYTTTAAAKLSIGQRRCRFPHENNLRHNAIYTYTMCRMECRIRLCLKYCRCVPHFYRNIGDEKTCDVKGLKCLANYQDELYKLINENGEKIDCKCFPLCDDVNYVGHSNTLEKWKLSTNLQWGVVYPKNRYRRDVIYGFTDLLVSFGSMAGMFLGCSMLSFVEIAYFIIFGLAKTIIRLCTF